MYVVQETRALSLVSPSLQDEEAALAPRQASPLLKDAPQWFPMRPRPSGFQKDGHSAFQDTQTIYSTYEVSYSF